MTSNNIPNTGALDGTGYIVVRVSTANGAIPISGAHVVIRGGDVNNSGVIYSLYTSSSGLTEKTALPAPSKSFSEQPGTERPYSSYNIDVFAEGYRDSFYANVPVFDTITSVQPANMIPKTENESPDSFTTGDEITYEGTNPEL